MNLFDMRTIVFSYLITNIICVWFVVQLWRQNRNRFAGTAFWVVDFIFQAVALFLIVMRGAIPDWTSMVLSNTLVISGAILGFMGQERFLGKRGPQIQNYLLVILFIIVHSYFTFVQSNLAVRTLNIAVALLLVCFQSVWLMWRRIEPGRRSQTFGVGMVNLLYCLVSSVRIAHFFVAPHVDNNFFLPVFFEELMLLSYQVLFILLTYSFVLMVNKRLIIEIGTQQEKFSKAFHSAPYAIMITRLSDGKIIEVNEKFTAISGYGRNEVLENSSIGLHLWERDEDRAAVVDELSKTGKVDGKEVLLRGKNGMAIVGLFSAEVLPIDGENCILSSIADITGRKRTEESVQLQEIQIRTILESTGDSILAVDNDGNVIKTNRNFADLWDIPSNILEAGSDEALLKHVLDQLVSPHAFLEKVRALYKSNAEGLDTILCKDGRIIERHSCPMLREGVIEGRVWSFRDITERKHIEDALRQSEASLSRAQMIAHLGNWEYDIETGKTTWSDEAYRIFGFSPHEVEVTSDLLLNMTHPEDRDRVLKGMNYLRDGSMQYDVEYRIIRRDGTERYVHSRRYVSAEGEDPGKIFGMVQDITDRRLAEEESRFQSEIMTNMTEAVYLVRVNDGVIVYTNSIFENMFGYGQGEMLGKHVSIVNAPSERNPEETAKEMMAEIHGKGSWQGEVNSIRKDGTLFWCYANVSLFEHTKFGRVLVSVHTDITGRKQAEETILLLNERISTATRSAQVGIWDWDVVNNRLEWDGQMYALYGQNREEFAGAYEAWLKGLHPDDRASCDEESRQALRGEKEYDTEFRVVWPDGSVHFIKAKGDVFRDADGKPLRMIGVNFDITERRQAEELLRESEMMNREMLESINDAFFSLDDNMIVKYFNPSAEKLLHRKADEVIGRNLLDAFPEARGSVFEKNYSQCIQTRETLVFEVEFTVPPYENWYDVRVYPAKYGISVFFQVTTDRKCLEKERLEMERQILHSQKLESLGVLAGGIAHDFNNLLMTILGNLELALDDISPLSPARPYLENTHTASKRAADLTRQMLAYSGKGRFVVEGMNLSELVQENIHLLRSSIPTTINLNTQLNRDIPPIMADSGQIQQVVMNLITNAAEAIGDSTGELTVTTGVQSCDESYLKASRLHEKPAPGEFVYLEVADTGCGMDEATQAKIFDPFFTTKFTGRGLGMSAMQGIIIGHKGAIFVNSEIGNGTIIRVIFPVSDADAEIKKSIAPEQAASLVTATSSSPGMILIVDDEDEVRKLCSIMVARIGYPTLVAADGEEAIAVFRDHADDIACIILDMTMPKMDGYATFQALKQLRPDVNVILSSGYNEQAITQRFTGLGLAGFIQKPYRRQQLQDELERVIKAG